MYKMRGTLVLLMFAAMLGVALGVGEVAFALIAEQCAEENKVTPKIMDIYFANGMKEAEATTNIKCYIRCTMMKQGNMDKDGVFHTEMAIKNLLEFTHIQGMEEYVTNAVTSCKNVTAPDHCDKANKISKCLQDYSG